MGKAETASRNKNVSGAADSGESRDGGTRAVSFSDDAVLLMACCRRLVYIWRNTRAAEIAQELAQHLEETVDKFEAGDKFGTAVPDACKWKQAQPKSCGMP